MLKVKIAKSSRAKAPAPHLGAYSQKHLTRQFYKISAVLGDYGLLENCICSYNIFRKVLLENLMCSNEILDKDLLENLICSYGIFSSWKIYVFLQNFEKALLEILMCSSTIFGSHGKFDVFL